MTRRPIILFDVMETLVTEPFFTAMPKYFGMGLDQLLAEKHPTSWIEFEKGRITEDEYLRTFFLDGRPVDGDGLRECLKCSYRWLEGMEMILAELRSTDFEVHALSNYPEWYSLIDESLNLSRFLKWTFVSCDTGVRKPDPQSYLGAAHALNVAPTDCLFIDDRSVNVDAAIAVGMDAILKKDAAQLRQELTARGCLKQT